MEENGYGHWLKEFPWTIFATLTFPRPNPVPGCPRCPVKCDAHWSIVGHARASRCFSTWWNMLLRDGLCPEGSWGTRGLERHKLGARHIHALLALPETAPRKGLDVLGMDRRISQMRRLWFDSGGGFSRIERCRSGEQAGWYVSKYATKEEAIEFFGHRAWRSTRGLEF